MTQVYAFKLGFWVHRINVEAKKIDDSTLKMIRIVLASFELEKKLGKSTFFHKTFLLADISVEVVLMMFFLTFSNVELLFSEQELS